MLLGKIITDDETRARFFRSPAETSRGLGLVLTEVEMEALGSVSCQAVRQLAMSLDPRIVRATLGNRESTLARITGDLHSPIRALPRASEDLAERKVELVSLEQ